METEDNNRELADKKWNSHQERNVNDLNEGFSGENLPNNYDPSEERIADRFKDEAETDESGRTTISSRERYPNDHSSENSAADYGDTDNSAIENRKSVQNRDNNYYDPQRYPPSHPDNQENRGNLRLDEE